MEIKISINSKFEIFTFGQDEISEKQDKIHKR